MRSLGPHAPNELRGMGSYNLPCGQLAIRKVAKPTGGNGPFTYSAIISYNRNCSCRVFSTTSHSEQLVFAAFRGDELVIKWLKLGIRGTSRLRISGTTVTFPHIGPGSASQGRRYLINTLFLLGLLRFSRKLEFKNYNLFHGRPTAVECIAKGSTGYRYIAYIFDISPTYRVVCQSILEQVTSWHGRRTDAS